MVKSPVATTALDGSAKSETGGVQELKSAEAILDSAEDWADKCQQQRLAREEGVGVSEEGEAAGRVRTLDARSALEVEG